MWTWSQRAGALSRDGAHVADGYSGSGSGKNNPLLQAAAGVGPIPQGRWRMLGVEDSRTTGPFTIVLAAVEGTRTFGRSAFRIHGDSASHPGQASHGCIILPRPIREAIWASGDHQLEVAG